MSKCIEVRTQAELDKALKSPDACVHLVGGGSFVVTGNSTVTAYGNSSVTAYDTSSVRAYHTSTVMAYDTSTVTAYGNSTVEAYGNSTVTAYDNATVTAYQTSVVRAFGGTVDAGPYVAVVRHGSARVTGGRVVAVPAIKTPAQWCEWNDLEVTGKGAARTVTVYKAVEADYTTKYGSRCTS
ncbi:MAG TPA: hypothetical protein VFN61_01920, partial [Acidimicrobiales bacterium]|nr:hypothetical protein [Acidimicrobiales bacterium]